MVLQYAYRIGSYFMLAAISSRHFWIKAPIRVGQVCKDPNVSYEWWSTLWGKSIYGKQVACAIHSLSHGCDCTVIMCDLTTHQSSRFSILRYQLDASHRTCNVINGDIRCICLSLRPSKQLRLDIMPNLYTNVTVTVHTIFDRPPRDTYAQFSVAVIVAIDDYCSWNTSKHAISEEPGRESVHSTQPKPFSRARVGYYPETQRKLSNIEGKYHIDGSDL